MEQTLFSYRKEDVEEIMLINGNMGYAESVSSDDIIEILEKLNGFRYSSSEKDPWAEASGTDFAIIILFPSSHKSAEEEHVFLEFGNSWITVGGYRYYSVENNYFSDEWQRKWEQRLEELVSKESDGGTE